MERVSPPRIFFAAVLLASVLSVPGLVQGQESGVGGPDSLAGSVPEAFESDDVASGVDRHPVFHLAAAARAVEVFEPEPDTIDVTVASLAARVRAVGFEALTGRQVRVEAGRGVVHVGWGRR